jgi:UDP-glucose 4-epimerase
MNCFVTGGAGFIGSNLVDRLLAAGNRVTAYDNFSTGQHAFLAEAAKHQHFALVEGDLLDTQLLNRPQTEHHRHLQRP